MAYTHSKYEILMTPMTPAVTGTAGGPTTAEFVGVQFGLTGVAAHWSPGYVPHIIRGAALVLRQKHTGDTNIRVGFDIDITTPGTATRAFSIDVPSGGLIGAHYHRPTYIIEVKPGMEVQAKVTAAATVNAGGAIVLYVEPRWEDPGNVTTMFKTTGVS